MIQKIMKLLPWLILGSLILGFLYGIVFPDGASYVRWLGDLFLRALKMVIVPLILSSIAAGVANIGSSGNLGRIGGKTIAYYLVTITFAILIGLVLVNLIQPGVGADLGFKKEVEGLATDNVSFTQTLMNIIPENVFAAFSSGDMLAIIFFALLFGFFLTRIEQKYQEPLLSIINGVFQVMMKITQLIIIFAPLGIFGIMAGVVADQAGDWNELASVFGRLGLYMVVVLLALAIHAFLVLPGIVAFIARVNPYKHLALMITPLITAFSTASSSATLPLTMNAVENRAGISNRVSSFVLPLGATINMNGTALYECVAAMFIAQAYGIDLTFLQQAVVVVTALLASIGAAGIPMAGLVMMTVILTAVGLPLEGIGLILAVDRILDMFRTSVNVWGDTCGTVVVAKSEGETLQLERSYKELKNTPIDPTEKDDK
jgi:proton glutamate symport protein